MPIRLFSPRILLLSLALSLPRLPAETLILSPSADGYIRELQSASETKNTTNAILLTGNTATDGDFLRALMAFDLSGTVLDGATINNARLTLTVSERDTSNGGSAEANRTINLHALDRDFAEVSVNWFEYANGSDWNSDGGDFGAVLATISANPATVDTGDSLSFSSADLTAVARAAQGGTLNLLAKVSPENGTRAIFRLGSRESEKVSGPRLYLDYTPATVPPSVAVTPVPGHPERPLSTRYTVTAGGHTIPTKAERFDFDVAMFTLGDEAVTVTINVDENFTGYSLKPDRHGIDVTRTGNVLSFTLGEPLRLILQVDDLTPLALIVTPPEEDVPSPDDADVLYFGPGITDAGVISPTSGQTVYLAPGALVKGRIEAKHVSNVTVKGRGLLETAGYSTRTGRTPGILFDHATDILVEGIGVRSYYTYWQTLYLNSQHVEVRDINLFGLGVNTDGVDIDAVKDFVVRDSFIRAEDDGLGWHSLDAATNGEMITERALADNIVIWNTGAGNGLRIGASMEAQLWRDITIRNVDILEHKYSGLYSDYSDWAWMQNLRFENITIERASSPITFQIALTSYSNSTGFLDERGHIDGLVFENVTMNGGTIKLLGYDATHRIDNVSFINCVHGGIPLTSAAQLTLNDYVTGLSFSAEPAARAESDPGIQEAEDLETRTNQLPQYIADDDEARTGRVRVCLASEAGDWLEHILEANAPGTYRLKVRIRQSPDSARAQLTVNDVPVGGELDFYAGTPTWREIDLGEVSLAAAGEQTLRFTVTGLNEASGGYRLDIDTFKLLTPLQNWRDEYFATTANAGDAANSADPDEDQVPNLLEYATGSSPLLPQRNTVLVSAVRETPHRLKLSFTRRSPAPVHYTVEGSDNLIGWSTVAALASGEDTWSGEGHITESVTGDGLIGVMVEDSDSPAPQRFLRLRVAAP